MRAVPRFFSPCPESVLAAENLPKITNTVAVPAYRTPIQLARIVYNIPNAKYNSERFPHVVLRIGDSTCLLFSSGRVVVACGRSVESTRLATHLYRLLIGSVKQPVIYHQKDQPNQLILMRISRLTRPSILRVVNLVGTGRVSVHPISLARLQTTNRDCVQWHPEDFPGAKVVIKRSAKCPLETVESCTAHVFDTGTNVIMGPRSYKDIYRAHAYLCDFVAPYRDAQAPLHSEDRFKYRIRSFNKEKARVNHQRATRAGKRPTTRKRSSITTSAAAAANDVTTSKPRRKRNRRQSANRSEKRRKLNESLPTRSAVVATPPSGFNLMRILLNSSERQEPLFGHRASIQADDEPDFDVFEMLKTLGLSEADWS